MKVMLVPSSIASEGVDHDQYLTSLIINGTIAVDAGSLGFYGSVEEQSRVRHVLISHSHIDHIASLPIFLENCFDGRPDPVTIHASAQVIDSLQRDMFNGRVWPDFIGMSSPATPFVNVETIEPGRAIHLDGLTITPVMVNHLVPTLGFVIDDAHSTVVIASDTASTDEIWRVASTRPNLKGVFLEAAFPNRMAKLADLSKHLTPAGFGTEAAKIPRGTPIFAVHIKARFRDEILAELNDLGVDGMAVCEPGRVYEF